MSDNDPPVNARRFKGNDIDPDSDGVIEGANVSAYPAWDKDSNGPINTSGVQEASITLSKTYDLIRVQILYMVNTSGSGQALQMRFNNNTVADYDTTRVDGTETNNNDVFALTTGIDDGIYASGDIQMRGSSWSGRGPTAWGPLAVTGEPGSAFATGLHKSGSPPVNSVQLRGASGTIDVYANIYGLEI